MGVSMDVFAGLSGLKAAVDIVKTLAEMSEEGARKRATAELLEKLLTAYHEQFALLERIRDLETQLNAVEGWNTEKQRYELVEFRPGVLAYAVKEAMRNGEPAHHLCARCYSEGKKSFLQPFATSWERGHVCKTCGGEILG